MPFLRGERFLRRKPWLPGIAIGGVWAGHLIAYAVVSPDRHERSTLLASTGHDYLAVAAPLMASVLIACVVGFVVEQVRRSAFMSTVTRSEVATQLVVIQLLAFVGMESVERFIHGAPPSSVVQPVVGIGVALQVLAACVSALLLFALGHMVQLVTRARRSRLPRVPATEPRGHPIAFVKRFALAGRPTLRGPPQNT
jgi:hypothetical protein